MTEITPLPFTWDGEAFHPVNPYWAKRCDEQLVVGERYVLIEHQERSGRSHRHYFACVHDAWMNLPEDLTERFPTSEHLRKWCLIKAGYCDERSTVCPSKADAERMAAFVRPLDDYAIVTFHEAVVTVYTAKSQSTRAMGKVVFQESKDKVLGVIAGMIGVDQKALQSNAGQAA